MNFSNEQSIVNSIKKTRIFLLDLVKDLSLSQLNKIPPGFNNNIIWNLGHMVASLQGMCYRRAGLPLSVDEKYILPFDSGTKPGAELDIMEVATIKELFLSSVDQLNSDLQNNLFTTYNTWTTRSGIELADIAAALQFCMYHEGVHSGYVMAMKRTVNNG